MKLSIIIPVFNEDQTIVDVLDRVLSFTPINGVKKEIIIVNDGSLDNTDELIRSFINNNKSVEIKYLSKTKNSGKGAAINSALELVTGDYTITQDADLEYDPRDINFLLKAAIDFNADVVYGSRFKAHYPRRVLFFWHSVGNKFLTFLSNVLTNWNLTDMETCYKLIRTNILKSIEIKEKRFGVEPEVTAKLSKVKDLKVFEVGISYNGRPFEEGKKINWKDGFRAIYCIVKYNLFT